MTFKKTSWEIYYKPRTDMEEGRLEKEPCTKGTCPNWDNRNYVNIPIEELDDGNDFVIVEKYPKNEKDPELFTCLVKRHIHDETCPKSWYAANIIDIRIFVF